MRVSELRSLGPRSGQGSQSGETDDLLFLPSVLTYEAGLPPEAGIPGFQDNVVPVISRTGANTVYSFILQYGSEEPVSVLGCCTSTSYYTDRTERPGHGLGPRTGPTG